VVDFIGLQARGEPDGEYSAEHKIYREASPINHVSSQTPPFFLIHGEADTTVPYEQSLLMKAALSNAGVPVELLCIPGAGHGPDFPGANNPPDYLGALAKWLDENLRDA